MTRRLATLATLATLAVTPATAQEDPMAVMAELGTPGEQHELLAKMVGDWTYTQKMWMAPEAPPMETTGTMTAESMLDGRFVKATWSSTVMGQPFTGIGINGYDNMTKQFTNVWMDSMMTSIMMFTGQCADDSCAVIEMSTPFTDPMTGTEMNMRMVSTWTGDDSFEVAGYVIDPDGNEQRNMELAVSRSE